MGIVLVIGGYLTYIFELDNYRFTGDFLLYIFNPDYNGSPDLTSTLLPWMGIAIIIIKFLWKVIPRNVADSMPIAAIFFSILLLPVILLWGLWSFSLIIKLCWMLCYLWFLWLLFYCGEL